MSCCNCHCSPCTCNVTEVRAPAPEARIYHFKEDGCCPIKGWYETLEIASWTPPANGDTTLIAVCDATQYPVGTCVLVSDGTNKRVLKVTGWNKDKDAIYVLGYANAENTGGSLVGTINSFPLAICPAPTEAGGVVCDRDYMVTAEAFVQPTAITSGGGTVKLVFDTPQTLQLGMTIYVVGAGYMEVSTPPGGTFVTCGTEFYAYNLGSEGNAGAGTTIAAGAAAYPDAPPATAVSGGDGEATTENYVTGSNGTFRVISGAGADADLNITLTGVKTDDLVEVWGEMNTRSPAMTLSFELMAGAASVITGISAKVYDGDYVGTTYVVNPYINVHHRRVYKATADGSLQFRWRWDTIDLGGVGIKCSSNIFERNLFARVIGNNP